MMRTGLILILLATLGAAANAGDIQNATYTVPAGPTSALTVFPLATASIVETSGLKKISFTLPEDLVGPHSLPVDLTQSPSPATPDLYSGIGVQAQCTAVESGDTACHLKFSPGYTQTTADTMKAFLTSKYAGQPELLKERLSVSDFFRIDPEGDLAFRE